LRKTSRTPFSDSPTYFDSRAADHLEIRGALEEIGGPDAVAGEHGQAVELVEDALEVFVTELEGSGDHHARGRAGGCLADLHGVVEADAGVVARDPVDLHAGLAALVPVLRQDLGEGRALAGDLDHVAAVEVQPLHVRRVQSGVAAPDVLGPRLGYPQLQDRFAALRHCCLPGVGERRP
jgi:hypothetical protein